jgi:hypothetical protein
MRGRHRDGGVLLALACSSLLLVALTVWALAQPVDGDRARLLDAMGPDSTNTTWTRPLAVPTGPPSPTPSSPAPTKMPSQADLLSGKTCLPLSFLLSNRPLPASGAFGYGRSVACERKEMAR